ncbi:STAS domain-containing protein [Polyangium aurulentum]|uniref:STAS domain-containing protein n=1 Tax=Polyangium aurulentum TaxID=2567896 RepID=UPI00146B7991|nr:STAS domain-containing protein [Polyangium aurulentum]UQA61881.1 PAS domain S-box protein [Polyangium aurulentum]
MSARAATTLRYDRFFETSGELLAVLALDGAFLQANSAFVDVLGYPVESLVGQLITEILPPEDAEAVRGALAAIEAGGATRLEASILHRDHSARRLAIVLRHVPEDGAVYLIGRDITPMPARDAAIERATNLLKKTQAMAKVGGWELDLRTNQLFWSDETYRIHEVPPGFEPILETAINFYAPEAVPVITEVVGACATRGEPYDVELQLITYKKRRIWVRAAGHAVWEDGKVVRLYGAFQDIDDVKRRALDLEEKLLIIEQQRTDMHSMSVPIIQVWDGVLALPVVGKLDQMRAADMTERVLDAVVTMSAHEVILDLTGVDSVDEATADHLVRIMRATRLLGAQSVVTGIRPAVAQTLVELGADMSGTVTRSNLREAIKAAMRAGRR